MHFLFLLSINDFFPRNSIGVDKRPRRCLSPEFPRKNIWMWLLSSRSHLLYQYFVFSWNVNSFLYHWGPSGDHL